MSQVPQASSASGLSASCTEFSHGQRMSYENFLASAISRGLAEDSAKLPWEQGVWVPQPAHLKLQHRHHAVGLGDLFVPSAQPVVSAPVTSIKHAYPDFVKKRLRLGTLHRDESEIRAQQLRKLRTIVLQDPSLSELGSALVSAAGALQDEDIVARSFRDAFWERAQGH